MEKISKKCLDLFKKASIDVKDVLNAVNLQNAYDGEASTISMQEAGFYEKGSLDDLEEKRRDRLLNQTVSDFINGVAKAATMNYPGGMLGPTLESRSDVYFNIDHGSFGYGSNTGLNQTTILHEALHSLTGLSDMELYTLLTGKTANPGESSASISKALKDNDCTK